VERAPRRELLQQFGLPVSMPARELAWTRVLWMELVFAQRRSDLQTQ
jgi:hypothetical protein